MNFVIPTVCRTTAVTAGLAAAMAFAAPTLFAQSNQNGSQQRESQRDKSRSGSGSDSEKNQDQQTNQDQDRRKDQDQQKNQHQDRQKNQEQQQSQDRQKRYRLSPEGWVRIATDYDGDGRYDAYEIIYLYDLEQAQQSSRQRRGGQAQNRSDQQTQQRQGAKPQYGQRRHSGQAQTADHSVQGKVTKLTSVSLAGMDKPYTIAKVESGRGRVVAVGLGPKGSLQELNLQQGDQIDVRGKWVRLNDRKVLMATNIKHDGQSKSVELLPRVNLKRVKATLLSKREVRFRGLNEPFIVGQVRTNSGKQQLVNLGPATKFKKLDVSNGDQLRLLVRQGRVNGQEALIAQEVEANGERIRISKGQDQDRFRKPGSNGDRS